MKSKEDKSYQEYIKSQYQQNIEEQEKRKKQEREV
jgi:hypothetical protein